MFREGPARGAAARSAAKRGLSERVSPPLRVGAGRFFVLPEPLVLRVAR